MSELNIDIGPAGGQRHHAAGEIRVNGKLYHATRGEIRGCRTFSLPEEPLRNACEDAFSGFNVPRSELLRDVRSFLPPADQGCEALDYPDQQICESWWDSWFRSSGLWRRLSSVRK